MLLKQLIEKYDSKHICKTPDAIYSITLNNTSANIHVKLPKNKQIPDEDMDTLESDLHYAIENVLKKFF